MAGQLNFRFSFSVVAFIAYVAVWRAIFAGNLFAGVHVGLSWVCTLVKVFLNGEIVGLIDANFFVRVTHVHTVRTFVRIHASVSFRRIIRLTISTSTWTIFLSDGWMAGISVFAFISFVV